MKLYFRLLTLGLTLSTAALLTTACGDKGSDPQAKVQEASLSGQITPVTAIKTVTATGSSKTATVSPTITGTYSFPSLPVGDYTLTFEPAPGYAAPAPVSARLAAGGTTVPNVTVSLAPAQASYVVNGTPVAPPYVYSLALAGDLSVTLSMVPGGGTGHSLTLFMRGVVPVVGSYSLDNNGDNTARYRAPNYELYDSDYHYGSPATPGTLTITSVSTSPRRFSGTFTFVGTSYSSTPAAPDFRTITNGVFTNVPY